MALLYITIANRNQAEITKNTNIKNNIEWEEHHKKKLQFQNEKV